MSAGTKKISPRGLCLIKEFEGFRSRPYRDAGGTWTIGYGETDGVGPGTSPLTEAAASRLLSRRINSDFSPVVNKASDKLNQHQFDALVSFVYNCGPAALSRTTGIGKAVRRADFHAVADELLKWCRAGGRVLPGLYLRRKEERSLFLSGAPTLDGYAADEKRWILEFDRLTRAKRSPTRRAELKALMLRRRKRIWLRAQKDGWTKYHRLQRYHSLAARTMKK